MTLMPMPVQQALEGGGFLRLLSAHEVLAAEAEGKRLAQKTGTDTALCANACLLARALRKENGKAVARSGKTLLKRLSVSHIQSLAKALAELDRQENPGLCLTEETFSRLKKGWSRCRGSVFAGVCSVVLGRSPHRMPPRP